MPRRSLPLLSRSSTAAFSATRSGSCQGRMTAAVPTSMSGQTRRQVGHQLDVVGHEGVVVEMVLGRPQAVEARVGGEAREPDLLVPDAVVRAVVPAVAGEHHHHADVHGVSLRVLLARMVPRTGGQDNPRAPAAARRGDMPRKLGSVRLPMRRPSQRKRTPAITKAGRAGTFRIGSSRRVHSAPERSCCRAPALQRAEIEPRPQFAQGQQAKGAVGPPVQAVVDDRADGQRQQQPTQGPEQDHSTPQNPTAAQTSQAAARGEDGVAPSRRPRYKSGRPRSIARTGGRVV